MGHVAWITRAYRGVYYGSGRISLFRMSVGLSPTLEKIVFLSNAGLNPTVPIMLQ